MIKHKKLGLKIAESPEEALIEEALKATEKRLREMKLSIELDEVVLEVLKIKAKSVVYRTSKITE